MVKTHMLGADQFIKHCNVNGEACMGLKPIEAMKTFFRLKFAIAQIVITIAVITSPFHLYSSS